MSNKVEPMKNSTLTPKLRFQEFRDKGEWHEVTVQDTATVIAGQSPSGEYYNDTGDGTPFYQGKADFGDVFINPPTKWTTQVTKLALENDILMSVRAPVGALNVSNQEICIGRGLAAIRAKGYCWFLYYLLLQANHLFVGNGGSVFDSITKSQIESIQIPFPLNPTEQQKIADCLSSLDELIAAENRMLNALKAHKKGLMQQLFPQPGQTQPRLRFPEFQGKGEWEEKTLGEVFNLQDGLAFKSTDFIKTKEGATQVVRITDINNKNTNEDKVFIPNDVIISNNLNKYLIGNGDLLLSLTGAAGFNFFIWDGGQAIINQRTLKITAKNQTDHTLINLLESLIYKIINTRGEGQNNNLSKEFLNNVTLLIPRYEEQHRIADCLSSLDAQITEQAAKIDSLKQHKRGLMQQLFPSPEEADL
jgi:type I restriction enzyme S subunit